MPRRHGMLIDALTGAAASLANEGAAARSLR